jgi:hypothetical protein
MSNQDMLHVSSEMHTFRIKHSWEKTENAIPMDKLMQGECNSFLETAWEYNQKGNTQEHWTAGAINEGHN